MPSSIADVLFARAQREPAKIAYRFFQGAALSFETLTFRMLWEQAAALAFLMQSHGLENQRALLVCRSQKNFVVAFYGCLLAGVIAVPTAPPRRKSLFGRLELIARDAGARAVIFDCDDLERTAFELAGETLAQFDLRSCMRSEDPAALAGRWEHRRTGSDDIVLLQYTSGSTADPKGVVVSHANLAHNCAAVTEAMAFSAESSLLTAVPLFHDLGLVIGVVEPMYVGCIGSFLSPGEFAQYPERWLQIISDFRITTSGGPNFMYDLAARSLIPEEIPDLDLSSWRVAFCGAEPIRAAVISRFTRLFERVGFKAEAFYPAYGLAEATLLVTGNPASTVPTVCNREGKKIVGCGMPWHDTQLEIVDPDTLRPVPEGEIGEIWISGKGVARGYWGRPELTTQTFEARLANDDPRRFLRTGDLGFLQDGELFISGRLKDLIIVNGQKYAPQDIEDEAERSHAALRQSGGAAFGVYEDNVERVVVIFELKRDWMRREFEWPHIKSAIRAAISTAYGLGVNDVVFIKPGALPRTSSGKVRRAQCRKDYLSRSLARPGLSPRPENLVLEASTLT
jgi:acyl-CoA synthetase (AMP-forming)/AMP-acid ligase II